MAHIEEDSPAGVAARQEVGRHIMAERAKTFISDGIALGYRYDPSPVVVPDGTPAPKDEVMTYTPTSRPGSRAPHAWLTEGKSTLDLFGRGFVLLRFGGADPSGIAAAAKSRGVPLEVVPIDDPAVATLYERKLVLVRPDGHVAWRADAAPDDPLAIVDTVRGAGIVRAARSAA